MLDVKEGIIFQVGWNEFFLNKTFSKSFIQIKK